MENTIHILNEENIHEEENKRTGLIISLFVHAFLIFLFLIPCFNFFNETPPQQTMGIFVALGEPDTEEVTDPAPSASEEEIKETEAPVEKPKPPAKSKAAKKPKVELPAQKAVVSKLVKEEAEVKAVEKEKRKVDKKVADKKAKEKAAKAQKEAQEKAEVAEREAEVKAQKEAEEAAARKKAEAAKQKAQKKADAKSKFSSLFGKGDKEANASKGQTNGHPDAKALEGLSTGKGKRGTGLGDRGVVYSPTITDNTQKTGRVVVDICIDKSGKVISAKYTQKGSTTTDAHLIDLAERNAKKYKFLKSNIEEQCGDIIIDFKLK